MKKDPRIVCLGGGIGTVQLIRGLREFTHNLTVVVSMADDGGSGGRLRRLYSIPPPGDLINCLAALSNAEPLLSSLLTFRFKGKRWGRDDSLGGQKLGNLILVALTQITGNFEMALKQMQRIFNCHGVILPATVEDVEIWAETVEGKKIRGEVNIDLGRYTGRREIKRVHLSLDKTTTPAEVLVAMQKADIIIAGPGDLYTTILPVILVKDIHDSLIKHIQKSLFIVNIANKPFETPRYHVNDYLNAIAAHIGKFPFRYTLVNQNQKPIIPKRLKYTYVPVDSQGISQYNTEILLGNLVDEQFPLYHDPHKIAGEIMKLL